MYCYNRAYIIYLHRDNKERIVYVSDESLPNNCFAIEHCSILLPIIPEVHGDTFLHPLNDDSSGTDSDGETKCIN